LRNVTPVDDTAATEEIKERIASSIYKQGEQARDAGDLETAVVHFQRLGQVVPDSEFRATAEYDAAAALITMASWDRATGVLEQYRRDYPDSEFADEINEKLAVTYMESGRGLEAAGEFERIAVAETSDDAVRREALWKAAELYEENGAISAEKRVLGDIVARYPNPLSESIEARFRLLEIAEAGGNNDEINARLRELVDVDARAGAQRSDRTRYLAAVASIRLADPVRKRFEVMKLTQPLAESMKLKRALMEDVIDAYTGAAEYGVAEVTTESTYRLAQVYEVFGRDVMESERPTDLDADALEQYELLLEEQVFPIEEKAIELYRANTDRAPDGIWDEWVERSFNRLAGLMPARYAKTERSEDVVTALY
jgi:tetratricopeptide (TPR) repeat protein